MELSEATMRPKLPRKHSKSVRNNMPSEFLSRSMHSSLNRPVKNVKPMLLMGTRGGSLQRRITIPKQVINVSRSSSKDTNNVWLMIVFVKVEEKRSWTYWNQRSGNSIGVYQKKLVRDSSAKIWQNPGESINQYEDKKEGFIWSDAWP